MTEQNAVFLRQALELAKTRRGFCAPNPAVGAVVVKAGNVLAAGAHQAAGRPHAEREALALIDQDAAQGSTLYVTLEPCCHHGRTPPCTDLIIERGIKAVYYGFADPNPQVAGRGARKLEQAGISCQKISLPEVDQFYQSYAYWWRRQRPWVTAKLAISLDGKITLEEGKATQLTGALAQQFTHQQRKQADALLTTVRSVQIDDPALNVRLEGETLAKPVYVLDRRLTLPAEVQLWKTAKQVILVHDQERTPAEIARVTQLGARCVAVPVENGLLSWPAIFAQIGQDGIHDLWVEAGARCFQSLHEQGEVQRSLIYIAPKLLGPDAVPAFSGAHIFSKVTQVKWADLSGDGVCEIEWGET